MFFSSKLHLFKWLIFTSKFHLFARHGTVLLAQPIGTALVHMYPTALLGRAAQPMPADVAWQLSLVAVA
jgi:hypothetical protein